MERAACSLGAGPGAPRKSSGNSTFPHCGFGRQACAGSEKDGTGRTKRPVVNCDQASLLGFFRGGKERLIQLLDYSSVASPESGLFSDWPRNKRYLKLSHVWLPVWQCDFRSKKSRELMNSIKASRRAKRASFSQL